MLVTRRTSVTLRSSTDLVPRGDSFREKTSPKVTVVVFGVEDRSRVSGSSSGGYWWTGRRGWSEPELEVVFS